MFTGIANEIGIIRTVTPGKTIGLEIESPRLIQELQPGGSINVDGACLTVMKVQKDSFIITLIPETYERTTLKYKNVGDRLNLERPLKIGEPLVGGMVSGLVDGVGVVKQILKDGRKHHLIIEPPLELMKYIAARTGLVINGIGLNTSAITDTTVEIPLYPYIIGHSTIGELKEGDFVSLEISQIARYVERLLEGKQ